MNAYAAVTMAELSPRRIGVRSDSGLMIGLAYRSTHHQINPHKRVLDVYKPASRCGGREVLCVCVDCGMTWPEGGLCGECSAPSVYLRRT